VIESEFEDITKARWRESLKLLAASPPEPIPILTLRAAWNSSTRPFRARGVDKREYVVKARQVDLQIERQMVNDQIVARLGILMKAPVGKPSLVEISSDLIEISPQHSYVLPGIAHATEFVEGCSDDRELFLHTKEPANRDRFALLCVLYSWVYASDRQFIYKKQKPNLVYSVDHGHFFAGGSNWTIESLNQMNDLQIDLLLIETCKLTSQELEPAVRACLAVPEDSILNAVATPPSVWGITVDDRLALIEYLISRQKKIMALFKDMC
jgi:hypothetical protein